MLRPSAKLSSGIERSPRYPEPAATKVSAAKVAMSHLPPTGVAGVGLEVEDAMACLTACRTSISGAPAPRARAVSPFQFLFGVSMAFE